jgi:hypothetical protein
LWILNLSPKTIPSQPPSIIGHSLQLKHLLLDLEKDNISHAYLFSGPPSIGKSTIARWFAREILMRGLSEDKREQVMHECDHFIHPDYIVLDQLWIEDVCEDWAVITRSSNAPQEGREKRKVKTDTIGIDDVRELSDALSTTSRGGYRVCIIQRIERMQDPAANAFLKILEEPPKDVVFLLTTDAVSDLLPTIFSRTRHISYGYVARSILEKIVSGETEEGALLLALSQRAPGKLITLKNDPILLAEEKKYAYDATLFWRTMTLSEREVWLTEDCEKKEILRRKILHIGLAMEQKKDDKNWTECMSAYHRLTDALSTNVYRPLVLLRFALELQSNQC